MEKNIEKSLSGDVSEKVNVLIRFYDVVRAYREGFELGFVILFMAILIFFIPWLGSQNEPEHVTIGLFALVAVSAVVFCFFVCPCYLLGSLPQEKAEDEDERDEDSEKAENCLENYIQNRIYSHLACWLSSVFYCCLIFHSIFWQFTKVGGIKDVYAYMSVGWLILCIYGGIKVFEKLLIHYDQD